LAVLSLVLGLNNVWTGITAFMTDRATDPFVVKLIDNSYTEEYIDYYLAIKNGVVVYYILAGVFAVIMALFLFKGVSDRSVLSLRLWVKINWICLVIFALLILTIAIAFSVTIPKYGVWVGFTSLVVGGVVLALSSYYIYVVKRYADIVEVEGRGGPGGEANYKAVA